MYRNIRCYGTKFCKFFWKLNMALDGPPQDKPTDHRTGISAEDLYTVAVRLLRPQVAGAPTTTCRMQWQRFFLPQEALLHSSAHCTAQRDGDQRQ
jgi:hypothetical protein